jgi:hypothetical protein
MCIKMREELNFFELESMPELLELEEQELDTLVLEQEMMHNNGGLWLETLKRDDVLHHADIARKFVPLFSLYEPAIVKQLAAKFPTINTPNSMLISSYDELLQHMAIGYQVAHFHYILGKKHYSGFPDGRCGMSAMNVALSLLNFGYSNVAFVYNNKLDHCYDLLPFVFKNTKIQGSILIDPTSDQLWKDESHRNSIIIKLGTTWEYKSEWAEGKNLFPDRIFSIDIMKSKPNACSDYGDFPAKARNCEKYLKRAFENPVEVQIKMKIL